MLHDVLAACEQIGKTVVCDEPGGQGRALAVALKALRGPVTIVNSDLPAVQPEELEAVAAAAPALVAAADGTTNALALREAADFRPLYGPGSAERFERELRARRLDLQGLVYDVDTRDDLEQVRDRVGTHTRDALAVRA